jgi:hypothetical protein
MFDKRLLLPSVPLLVALVVSSILTHSHVRANNSDTTVKETEVLKKYVALCGDNSPDKIQLMQTLSPVERAFIWRVHLGLYLSRHATLSRDQQSVVIDTLALVGPELFSPPDPKDPGKRTATLEQVDLLRRRGLQVFSKDEAAEIFSAVGGTQDGESLGKYARLSELSKSDRKASFNQMDAADKSSLWRVHLGLNLARHPEWTEEQRAIVLEAITMATPQMYQAPKDSNWNRLVGEPVRVLTYKALVLFTKQEGAALFSELGLNEQPKSNHARRPAAGNCGCSTECDWCTYQCVGGADCTVLYRGCGTFWMYPCDGACSAPPPPNN